LAEMSTDRDFAARVLQAQMRCLFQAREISAALGVLDALQSERFESAQDEQGRLIVPNALLLALEFVPEANEESRATLRAALRGRVVNYAIPGFSAAQRRFLMRELQR